MQRTGQGMLKLTAFSMTRQAYNSWQTVVNESIVRVAVIIYMMENGFSSHWNKWKYTKKEADQLPFCNIGCAPDRKL